jgi:hypothetical protein
MPSTAAPVPTAPGTGSNTDENFSKLFIKAAHSGALRLTTEVEQCARPLRSPIDGTRFRRAGHLSIGARAESGTTAPSEER